MSRTGTTKWRKIRDEARRLAIENGIYNCPICGVGLDYEYSRQPNSAEADHILPFATGGRDELANVQIICRWCNRRKSDGTSKRIATTPKIIEPMTSVAW